MNQELNKALEAAIKIKVKAEKDLADYDVGRVPFAVVLKEATKRYKALEQAVVTGEWTPELFDDDADEPIASAPPPNGVPVDDRPGDRGPTDFHGHRQRKAKPQVERADALLKTAAADGFPAFDISAGDGKLRAHLAAIEAEGEQLAADPFATAASRQEAERQKRRDRDGRRKTKLAEKLAEKLASFVETTNRKPTLTGLAQDANAAIAQGLEPPAESVAASSRPYTSEDLDRAITHAIMQFFSLPVIERFRVAGATNDEIQSALYHSLPSARHTVRPDEGRRYTIEAREESCYLWIDGFQGVGHKATLVGSAFISRVRDVMKIPTPSAAAKAAKATFREPSITTAGTGFATHVRRPREGWDSASLANAAEDLGVTVGMLAVCSECLVVFPGAGVKACPACQAITIGPPQPAGDADMTAPPPKIKNPKKKARIPGVLYPE